MLRFFTLSLLLFTLLQADSTQSCFSAKENMLENHYKAENFLLQKSYLKAEKFYKKSQENAYSGLELCMGDSEYNFDFFFNFIESNKKELEDISNF